jgi:hypothetical protein
MGMHSVNLAVLRRESGVLNQHKMGRQGRLPTCGRVLPVEDACTPSRSFPGSRVSARVQLLLVQYY